MRGTGCWWLTIALLAWWWCSIALLAWGWRVVLLLGLLSVLLWLLLAILLGLAIACTLLAYSLQGVVEYSTLLLMLIMLVRHCAYVVFSPNKERC
jgi:hypothetical protein